MASPSGDRTTSRLFLLSFTFYSTPTKYEPLHMTITILNCYYYTGLRFRAQSLSFWDPEALNPTPKRGLGTAGLAWPRFRGM